MLCFDKIHALSRRQLRGALSNCTGWKEKEGRGGDQECKHAPTGRELRGSRA